MNKRFDCIVIGGGHNGLVAAAYLARGGKRVCVLERRHVLGGCSVTEELWPGFKVSVASYVISLFRPEIIRELRLKEYGLNILPRNPSSFTPLLDGRSLLMGSDERATCREIAKFSKRDAERYPAYNRLLERVSAAIEPLLARPAPDPLPLPADWRRIGVGKKLRDAGRMLELYQSLSRLGDNLPEAIELVLGAARPFLERWFDAEVLRATLATDAVIGAFASPSYPGTAYVLLHHVMGEVGGHRGVWGYVQGGMGALATALERACMDLGVEIRRESAVKRIVVERGQARGVALWDDTFLEAPIIASSIDAHQTFERLIEPAELPSQFRNAVAKIDYASASAKINLALAEPPQFTCLPAAGIAAHHRGTIHISPTLDYIERAFDDAKYGWPSTEPILEITLPSAVDSTLAPPGQHVMNIFVQYAPYKLADGRSWDDVKEDFGNRCIELLARYAPNVAAAILHRQILTPLDLERLFGLTGGNIMQGAMTPTQLFAMRPVAGWADHHAPVAGLYLCGAAAHPGGGVLGACGRNAANEILNSS
jgi:phytoene dehydrogenase-like protein